jgi:NADH:ubiquinone oxidoreductase subunit 4 (subunit M)
MLRAVRNILHGPIVENANPVRDAASLWRKFPYALLLASLIVFGFYPRLLTDKIKPSAAIIVEKATKQNPPAEKPAVETALRTSAK